MTRLVMITAILGLSIAAAGCSQGNSDNVMAPDANALTPADVNLALGPDVANAPEPDMATNDANAVGNSADNGTEPDEAATNNSND